MFRVIVGSTLFLVSISRADDWKPAPAPLMTRWAKNVSPTNVHPEYPRPMMVREKWQNLNGLWQYAPASRLDAPPFGEELTGRILVPFPIESSLSGVGTHMSRFWYRRTFEVPKDWTGQRILLHFGAVDWEAKVWLNGKPLGEHRGGYDNFSFDLTEHLKKDGPQELIVGVYDPTDEGYQPRGKQVRKPEGIWYTPSTGIWQTVWIEPVASAYIADLKILPDIDGKKVQVKAIVVGGTDQMEIEVSALWDKTGTPGSEIFGSEVTVVSNGLHDTHSLIISKPKAWLPESPFLYDLQVQLREGKKVVDEVHSYFAMRKIEVVKGESGVNRIHLNGKPYFMIAPLDQGFWPDGLHTAPTDEALKFDIEMTKKLGFNTTRKHIKVEPQRWYYWCDKLGLLVWQDMPSGDREAGRAPAKEIKRSPESVKQYDLELKRMIDQLHNHPCIVMWVPFNEGWGQFDTKRVTEWVKKYDPTRLVNNASGWNDMGAGDVNDVHVYPGPGAPPLEPTRAGVLGEFGGLGLAVKGHLWNENIWSYQGVADSAELTRKYERLMQRVYDLKQKGLCAAVYTQLTDVEVEANGLLTYDRTVIKANVDRIAAANRGDFSKVPQVEVVVPTSEAKGIEWHYTFDKPADGWFKPDFDVSNWKRGEAGFGTRMTPGTAVRTEWKTNDIWIRREFELPDGPFDNYLLRMHHDEDAEVYLNGVLAARVRGFTTAYDEFSISDAGKKALKKGKNVIAIHCKQTGGGQYIDAGLVRVK